DVALVHQGDAAALVLHRVTDRAVDQALGAEPAHRLEADADLDADVAVRRADRLELLLPLARRRLRSEADVLERLGELLLQEIEHLGRLGRSANPFDAG